MRKGANGRAGREDEEERESKGKGESEGKSRKGQDTRVSDPRTTNTPTANSLLWPSPAVTGP